MQSVVSYRFRLDNSTDTHIAETNKDFATGHIPLIQTLIEGDVVPPLARYLEDGPNEYLVAGKNKYFTISKNKQYMPLGESQDTFIVTGGLNDPQEYINFTLDTAKCATILGDENVAGVATTHLRFILPTDSIGMHDQGAYKYSRDIWVEKDTHYLRQLQITEMFYPHSTCEDDLKIFPFTVRYTSAILLYLKHNEPITPPFETPLERVPMKP